jgi:hypothetical protein
MYCVLTSVWHIAAITGHLAAQRERAIMHVRVALQDVRTEAAGSPAEEALEEAGV